MPELKDLVRQSRTYRRFNASVPVTMEDLRDLVELARFTPSASNLQPLRFMLVNDADTNAKIFPSTSWAGYLTDWKGPAEDERPVAYIVVLCDTQIAKSAAVDSGIAAQTMMLGAVEKGFGGCMLSAINRDRLRRDLNVPEQYDILLVLALGKPAEQVVIEDVGEDGSIKYHRDADGIHYVPKRSLDELIVEFE